MSKAPRRGRAEKKPDCRACGLCCVAPSDQDVFCDVMAQDERRLGRRFVRLHVLHPSVYDALCAAVGGASLPHGIIRTAARRQQRGPFAGYADSAR